MISLIGIRLQYIKRHLCLLVWTYLFLPIIILLAGLINLSDKENIDLVPYNDANIISENNQFFTESYTDLEYIIRESLFVVDEMSMCGKINSYINNITNIPEINCTNNENKYIKGLTNTIKIKGKNRKYKIYIDSKSDNNLFKSGDLDEDIIVDPFNVRKDSKRDLYIKFFKVQSFLSRLLIEINGGKIKSNFEMDFGFNPYPTHYKFTDEYDSTTASMLSFLMCLQFSLIAYNFNMRMIDEKENKLNILLERQGISKLKYIFSWLLTFITLFSFSIISFFILLIGILHFHYFLLFVILICFALTIFSVCVFFTTCIKTVKSGETAVKFYNFGSLFLGFVIVLYRTNKLTKILFCFIPQINIYISLNCLFSLNNFENLSWDLVWLKANKMSFMETIIMYIASIIFYLGLSIIIESYRNSGLPFLLYLKSCFVKVSRKTDDNSSLLIENVDKVGLNYDTHHQDLSPVNQQKKEQNNCLKIINVSKNFDDLKAVDNFSGELFPDEIFCLLGHNGAGKTTLINMISGIFDPDQGDILLNNKSVVTDKNYLYKNIGLCQQENIFFDYLTVEEHLSYMCRIKGSSVDKREIENLINQIDLSQKKSALCSTLSGGQKRKLCIALSLIGNSKIILLDEPTSGMDIMARRALWEFLKNYKKNKIILLTTHFLDEAEYLGDRIGIMSDGKFLCSGTSSFLKSKYPCGFNINLLINSSIFNETIKQDFYNGIIQFEPNAEIKVASKGIFSINIQSNNQHIQELFDYIELNKAKYGIEDYTVSSTSLEDVFLKINNKGSLGDLKYEKKEEPKEEQFMNEIPEVAGFFSQLVAHTVRSIYPFYRNKFLFFSELLSGLGFVYLFVFFFSDFIINITTKQLNNINVLEENDIYYYEKTNNEKFLKNSHTYKFGNYITLKKIKEEPKDFKDFMELSYKNAFANIAKGSIYIEKTSSDFYKVYNSETCTSIDGYLNANTMLFVSAFLKKEYDIEATIFPKINYNYLDIQEIEKIFSILTDSVVLIIICLISNIGYTTFLGGLMHEKIREKRKNIKHLLYLSGTNIWIYWLGFFIIDYIKLLIFDILLIIPVYYVNGAGTFFFFDMLAINLSALSFIYFISFFCSNDDAGAKVLFFITFGTIIVFGLIFIVSDGDVFSDYMDTFMDPYIPRIFDITPVTSMIVSFIRIIISFNYYESIDAIYDIADIDYDDDDSFLSEFKRPSKYLFGSYLFQLLNFIFYTLLLIFAESGFLGKLIHNLHLCILGKKNNYEFGKEEASEEFMGDNNIGTPFVYNAPPVSLPTTIDIPINYDNNINSINDINSNGYNSTNIINKPLNNNAYNPPLTNNNINLSSNYNSNIMNSNQPMNYNSNYATGISPINTNNINNINQSMNYNSNYANGISPINNNNFIFDTSKNRDPLLNPYVRKEINKINNQQGFTTIITALIKTYYSFSSACCCKICRTKNVRAINNLYLGLEPNEKFGLLGFNGSGKTTTFRAITNEILADSGNISLFGYNTKTQFKHIRTLIGYCPQVNPLFDFLKVKEIIRFYSKLKTCRVEVNYVCEKFGLSKYKDTYIANLSGGNKRKLTFAIAMMNKPSLLLLDEPSTGVDPESRRIMWRNINELSNSGHKYNMILTTHSMEEAEVLCDTVSWFKAGNFIAKGNPEELKLQHSAGYKLHVKFDLNNADKSQLTSLYINETFNKASSLIGGMGSYSHFILSNPGFEPYLILLITVIERIRNETQKITLISIGKDLSFELVISIIKERQKDLFVKVLNMKNIDKSISEMSISMQSLENILTSLN